ncbi:hypothetical protein ROZALSC1DRAFT_23677, partial [Rozella allomycis CSF55]
FGLRPEHPVLNISSIPSRQSIETKLKLLTDGPTQSMNPINNLQVAIKNNLGVFYFQTQVPLFIFFSQDGLFTKENFLSLWKEIPEETVADIHNCSFTDLPHNDRTGKLKISLFYIAL